MSIIQFSPNLLLCSVLLIAFLNIFTPLVSRNHSALRSYIMISASICFLINVGIIDFAFLQNIESSMLLFAFEKYSIAFNTEALGMIFLNLLALLWPIAQSYTDTFLKVNKIENSSSFLFFLNASMLMGIAIALSANLFSMFVSYELLTLCTIPLIVHLGGDSVRKGLSKYLTILMTTSLALFLPAVLVIYSKIGHGNFGEYGILGSIFSNEETIILLLLFMFGISKAALFPVHGWLPSAMVATYPVSALLHAVVVVKSGIFCLCKIFVYVFGLDNLQLLFSSYNWLIFIPIITVIYSSVKAFQHSYLKSILAFSTISQLSLSLLSLCLFSPRGIMGAIMHMISHSFTKISLFYIMGAFYSAYGTLKLEDLKGLHLKMPKLSIMFLVAGASLIGIPPFAGFISKLYILFAAVEAQNLPAIFTLLASTILTAAYTIRLMLNLFSINSQEIRLISPLPRSMNYNIFLCVALICLFALVSEGISWFLLFV